MKYLITTYNQYKNFLKENKTDRIDKFIKIIASDNKKLETFFNLSTNEIFDSEIKTEYTIYDNKNNLTIKFLTNSNTEYRLDLFLKNEKEKGLVYHIGFSTWEVSKEEYNIVKIEKYEMIEILNRIKFIIKDLIRKNKLKVNYFCVGASEISDKKNDIYEYFLKIVLGNNNFQKLETDLYSPNWGLYFKIK